MAISIPNAAYDAYFAYFAACTRLSLVSGAGTPTDLTGELAYATLTAGAGNGDFTVGAGDPSGRRLTVAEQTGITVDADGTTTHGVLSYFDDPNWIIRLVTTCSERLVSNTDGDQVNMGSFYLQVAAPSAV